MGERKANGVDVVELMKKRLAEAEGDVERLKAAIAHMEGEGDRPSAARRRIRSGRSAASKLSAEDLLRLVPPSGISRGLLVEQTKAPISRVSSLLKSMENEGLIRREGQRKLTRWYPVTDEDRVAGRAAQLRKQSGVNRPGLDGGSGVL